MFCMLAMLLWDKNFILTVHNNATCNSFVDCQSRVTTWLVCKICIEYMVHMIAIVNSVPVSVFTEKEK